MDAVYALGRVAVIVIFLALGVSELANIDKTAADIQTLVLSKPFIVTWWPPQATPTIVAAVVAGLQVICGLLVLFGYWTRTAAFILLVGTIGYIVFANELFTVEAWRKMIDQNQALNLSLIGALLMLTAAGAGGWSVDGRARPNHSV
jgi:putative oxidoreductase